MDIIEIFNSHFSEKAKIEVTAPGRVNLLGEHVDYNQGPVLPAAIHLSVTLAAAPWQQGTLERPAIKLYAVDLEETCSFFLDCIHEKVDVDGTPLPEWALHPAGVAWALQQAGYHVKSSCVAYTSSIPMGAGLSSSAAIQVAFAVLWQALGGWDLDRLELATLCQKAENQFVGVSSGLMDQFTSACGVAGHALFFDTRDLSCTPVPLPENSTLVIANTGIMRSLVNSEYNLRKEACEQAVLLLKKHIPEIQSLRDIKTTEFAAYGPFLPDPIRQRAEHVVKEIHRVQSAYQALLRHDKQALGALMFAGHRSLRDLYEVSIPELDLLVELARDLPGIIGARLTGAGFGGCTVNLVECDYTESFCHELERRYSLATGNTVTTIQGYACQGASYQYL